MRRIAALVLFVMLLCACTARPLPTAEPPAEGWTPVGDRGNLWAVPAETEGVRQLLRSPEGLVLVRSGAKGLDLTLLSEEDLSVTGETAVAAGDYAFVQVLDDGISIADPEADTVTMLGNDLSERKTVLYDAGTNTWLMGLDGNTLFTLDQTGITVHDLTTGSSRQLLECRTMSIAAMAPEQIFLGALGVDDLMTHWYALDLLTGSLTELDEARMIALQEGLKPLGDDRYVRSSGGAVTLYDSEGRFQSTCALSAEASRAGQEFVWSEAHGGWFFLEYTDGAARLLFWDPAVPTSGEDVDIAPDPILEGTILPAELYERAEELSGRFDLDIRIGDLCLRGYKTYDSEVLTDPELTSHSLDVLEQVLSQYPEGFFTQLKYGNRHSVRIELVDGLSPVAGKDVSSGTSAVTFRWDRCCVIALNAHKIRPSAIFHEFSHIIDDRMLWEALFREDALYSEESWLALQPEGFEYAGSYQNIPDSVKQFYDSGWFATNYGCVSATEDRAVTMEHACTGQRSLFTDNPHLMAKLEYYCACIRDSFDTEGWPEVTPWEQFLD